MNHVADRVDLAIDLLTLGQYGLEQIDPPAELDTTEPDGGSCGARSRRPSRPRSSSRATRRRAIAHSDYEWGWPSRNEDGGPSPASSLWALANT